MTAEARDEIHRLQYRLLETEKRIAERDAEIKSLRAELRATVSKHEAMSAELTRAKLRGACFR